MDMNLSKLRKITKDRGDFCAAVHRVTKSQTGLSDEQQLQRRSSVYGMMCLGYMQILHHFI